MDASADVLAVMVLCFNVVVPPPTLKRPEVAAAGPAVPEPGAAELPLTVLFSRINEPVSLAMPPPSPGPPAPAVPAPPVALFPPTVDLSKFTVPRTSFAIPPPRAAPPTLPAPPLTELPATVHSVSVTVPLLWMPPPEPFPPAEPP